MHWHEPATWSTFVRYLLWCCSLHIPFSKLGRQEVLSVEISLSPVGHGTCHDLHCYNICLHKDQSEDLMALQKCLVDTLSIGDPYSFLWPLNGIHWMANDPKNFLGKWDTFLQLSNTCSSFSTLRSSYFWTFNLYAMFKHSFIGKIKHERSHSLQSKMANPPFFT